MSTHARYRRLRKLDGAQALEDQIAVLATQWVMNWRNQSSVPDELAIIHKLTDAALVRAAEAWNRRHHALRTLPREIFELCWSFLETRDLLRVAATCKVWRQLIHDAPALWTDLTCRGYGVHSAQLGPLLALSRDSLFGLCVSLYGSHSASELGTALRPHAHRLRRLELQACPLFSPYDTIHMEFSAPALRTFACDLPGLSFREGNFIFSCPNLERMTVATLTLDHQVLPVGFGRVTSLTCGWSGGSLQGLYDAFPALASLEICRTEHSGSGYHHWTALRNRRLDLPRDRPPPETLRRVVLRGIEISYDDLAAFGLLSVRELEIHGAAGKFADTLTLFDSLGGTPRSAKMLGKQLVICADGPRELCMTFNLDNSEHYYTVLSRPAVRDNIISLSFEWPPAPPPGVKPDYVIPADEFPALTALVLPVGYPLLDMDHMPACGKLRAPALRCLAIIDTARNGVARSLKPLFLAVFIARHLELASGRKLDDLVLDGEHGVALCEPEHEYDDGLEILQNHVSSISHKYCPGHY